MKNQIEAIDKQLLTLEESQKDLKMLAENLNTLPKDLHAHLQNHFPKSSETANKEREKSYHNIATIKRTPKDNPISGRAADMIQKLIA